ncbi:MAG: hypothetical protein RLZZ319_58 [Actinomycetota bacterium]|jgi:hypothetical protein
MIDAVTWTSVAVALVAGVVALIAGIRGRTPSDYTVGGLALVELALIVLGGIAIAAPLNGNPPTGDLLEFWMYLGTALLMPPLVIVWSLVDRTRFGTVALGVVGISIAVMIVRMNTIWFG